MNKTHVFTLPDAPYDDYLWRVSDYDGNYDDGVYHTGERVLVQLRRHRSILGFRYTVAALGVNAFIVPPTSVDVETAAQNILNQYAEVFRTDPSRLEL